jgi:hypothetical protein
VALPEQCRVEHEVTERQTLAVQQLLLSTVVGDAADSTVCLCAVSFSCRIQDNKGSMHPVCNNFFIYIL